MAYIENSDNPIVDLTYQFGVRIVKFYKYLTTKQVYVLSKQLLRCGTSIGANAFEGKNAQSRADFSSKMNIALKEATESGYWIDLLYDTDYLDEQQYESISGDCFKIIAVLTKIVKATKC